jgi:hypothetical protein
MTSKKLALQKPFILTKDLYRWYLLALLVSSYLDYRDKAKAFTTKKPLDQIYRNISLIRLYESLGANSRSRRLAVKAALQVYYVRTSRGSQLTATNSSWMNIGTKKPYTTASARVLKAYRLINEETLMKLELNLYDKDAFEMNIDGSFKLDKNSCKIKIAVPEISLQLEYSHEEIQDLIKLFAEIDAEDAALAAKKPRKARGPDSEEVKAKKRAAAIARHAKAADNCTSD